MNRRTRTKIRRCQLCLPFLLLAFLAACSRQPKTITNEWPAPPPQAKLTVAAGDTLDVKFRFNPELNESQMVRPDGVISLPIIDDVEVAGLSPSEIDKKLTEAYKPELVQPVLTVIVRTVNKQRVYVGGEVNKPGAYPMNGKMTALEAVMEAGGFNYTSGAKAESVVVIRHVNGKRYARLVDLKSPLVSSVSDPFDLAGSDIVYVPRTTIAKVDLWVDQYINKLIPTVLQNSILFAAFNGGNNNNNN